jgi:hypothetical protein
MGFNPPFALAALTPISGNVLRSFRVGGGPVNFGISEFNLTVR